MATQARQWRSSQHGAGQSGVEFQDLGCVVSSQRNLLRGNPLLGLTRSSKLCRPDLNAQIRYVVSPLQSPDRLRSRMTRAGWIDARRDPCINVGADRPPAFDPVTESSAAAVCKNQNGAGQPDQRKHQASVSPSQRWMFSHIFRAKEETEQWRQQVSCRFHRPERACGLPAGRSCGTLFSIGIIGTFAKMRRITNDPDQRAKAH